MEMVFKIVGGHRRLYYETETLPQGLVHAWRSGDREDDADGCLLPRNPRLLVEEADALSRVHVCIPSGRFPAQSWPEGSRWLVET